LILFLPACQNQQEEIRETKQKSITKDQDDALLAYMRENKIVSLFVSQEQRKLAKQNLDFIAKFLAPFLANEQFVDVFTNESKKNLAKGEMPHTIISNFLRAYEAQVGKPLFHSSNQYRVDNEQLSKFLDLIEGFPLETDKSKIIIKPRMYMALLDNRFFSSYEKPKGIFTSHFLEKMGKTSFHSINGGKMVLL